MTLTQEERNKVADYLEMDAASTRAIIKQMQALSADPVIGELIKKNMAEAAASEIVARKLRSIQDA